MLSLAMGNSRDRQCRNTRWVVTSFLEIKTKLDHSWRTTFRTALGIPLAVARISRYLSAQKDLDDLDVGS